MTILRPAPKDGVPESWRDLMEKLDQKDETIVTTEDDPSLEPHPYITAHRAQHMQKLLRAAASALNEEGPDAATLLLLEGIGAPEEPEVRPVAIHQPLRIHLMDLRIESEQVFDRKYLKECIPPVVELIKECTQAGWVEIHIPKSAFLKRFLKDIDQTRVHEGLAVRRIAAWFVRQGIEAECVMLGNEDFELVVYIPDRS